MKLIVTNSLPTSRLFANLLHLEALEKFNIEVEFWDLAPLHFNQSVLNDYFSGSANYAYKGPNHRSFESHSELSEVLFNYKNAIFWHLSRFGRVIRDESVMDIFSQFNAKYFFQHIDVHDDIYHFSHWPRYIAREARQKFYNWNYRPLGVVTSGQLGYRQVKIRYPKTSIIDVRTPKVLWEKTNNEIPEPYVVFVDESLIHDPDTKLHGTRLVADIGAYYLRMRQLFDLIEQTLGMPVVIACSGKFEYQDPIAYFGERKVLYCETRELISNSKLVVGHLSLALDQAVISDKPVLLIDDPDFTEYRRFGFRDVIIRFESKPILNSSVTPSHLAEIMLRDRSFYVSKLERYFRSSENSPEISNAVGEFVKTIYHENGCS